MSLNALWKERLDKLLRSVDPNTTLLSLTATCPCFKCGHALSSHGVACILSVDKRDDTVKTIWLGMREGTENECACGCTQFAPMSNWRDWQREHERLSK